MSSQSSMAESSGMRLPVKNASFMDVNVGTTSGKSTASASTARGVSLVVNVLAGEKNASVRLPVNTLLVVTCCGTCALKT